MPTQGRNDYLLDVLIELATAICIDVIDYLRLRRLLLLRFFFLLRSVGAAS
jgi:hypothetical protein